MCIAQCTLYIVIDNMYNRSIQNALLASNCYKPIINNGIVTTGDVIKPGTQLELKCGMFF